MHIISRGCDICCLSTAGAFFDPSWRDTEITGMPNTTNRNKVQAKLFCFFFPQRIALKGILQTMLPKQDPEDPDAIAA